MVNRLMEDTRMTHGGLKTWFMEIKTPTDNPPILVQRFKPLTGYLKVHKTSQHFKTRWHFLAFAFNVLTL